MNEEKTVQDQVEEVVNKLNYFVAFKHGYGVLLGFKDGKPIWSLKTEGLNGKELATTFTSYDDLMKFVTADVGVGFWPDTGVQIRLVFPSANVNGQPAATLEDCANVGLPRWDGK
jgi:hypothetical protein